MSTRCQVLVEGATVILYRHNDGYPDGSAGVLEALLPLVRDFKKYRGHDPDWLAAHIIAEFIRLHRAWAAEMISRLQAGGAGDRLSVYRELAFLGHGVEAWNGTLHGDIEYLYVVKVDHVEIRVPLWRLASGNACVLANTKVARRVAFNGKTYKAKKQRVG